MFGGTVGPDGDDLDYSTQILESVTLLEKKQESSVKGWITCFDLFPKIDPKYLRQSMVGGLATLLLYAALVLFFLITIYQLLYPQVTSKLSFTNNEKSALVSDEFFVDIDITVSSPCDEIAVTYSASDGSHILVGHLLNIKEPTNDTCNFSGRINLQFTSGTLRFIPVAHLSFVANTNGIQQIIKIDPRVSFNHIIHKLEFGNAFPGRISPLSSVSNYENNLEAHSLNQYFISIIPTNWKKKTVFSREAISSFQYAAQSYYRSVPLNSEKEFGIFFSFDFDTVIIEQSSDTWIRNENGTFGDLLLFVIQMMGILGGLGALSDGIYILVGLLSHVY